MCIKGPLAQQALYRIVIDPVTVTGFLELQADDKQQRHQRQCPGHWCKATIVGQPLQHGADDISRKWNVKG